MRDRISAEEVVRDGRRVRRKIAPVPQGKWVMEHDGKAVQKVAYAEHYGIYASIRDDGRELVVCDEEKDVEDEVAEFDLISREEWLRRQREGNGDADGLGESRDD